MRTSHSGPCTRLPADALAQKPTMVERIPLPALGSGVGIAVASQAPFGLPLGFLKGVNLICIFPGLGHQSCRVAIRSWRGGQLSARTFISIFFDWYSIPKTASGLKVRLPQNRRFHLPFISHRVWPLICHHRSPNPTR